MNRKIIIFGATGNTGIEICRKLEENSLNYSVFIRKGSEAKLHTSDAQIITGNVLEPADVNGAINEYDYTDIIIALGSRDFKSGSIRANGTRNIINSLKSSGKKAKIHVVSANGVGASWTNLSWIEKLFCRLVIPKAMKDHELQEKIVKNNTEDYHIIRPVGLSNDTGTGKVTAEIEKALPKRKVSRANVACYLVESMIENVSGEHSICDA